MGNCCSSIPLDDFRAQLERLLSEEKEEEEEEIKFIPQEEEEEERRKPKQKSIFASKVKEKKIALSPPLVLDRVDSEKKNEAIHPLKLNKTQTAVVGSDQWFYYCLRSQGHYFQEDSNIIITVDANAPIKIYGHVGKLPTTLIFTVLSNSFMAVDDIYRAQVSLSPHVLSLANGTKFLQQNRTSIEEEDSEGTRIFIGIKLDPLKQSPLSQFGCSFSIVARDDMARLVLGNSLDRMSLFKNFSYHFVEIPSSLIGYSSFVVLLVEVKLPASEVIRLLIADKAPPNYQDAEVIHDNFETQQRNKDLLSNVICQSVSATEDGVQMAIVKVKPGRKYYILVQGWRVEPIPYTITTKISPLQSLSENQREEKGSENKTFCTRIDTTSAFLMGSTESSKKIFIDFEKEEETSSFEMLILFIQATQPVQLLTFVDGREIETDLDVMSSISSFLSAPLAGMMRETDASRHISSLCILPPCLAKKDQEGGIPTDWNLLVKRCETNVGGEIYCSLTTMKESVQIVSGRPVFSSILPGIIKCYLFETESVGCLEIKVAIVASDVGEHQNVGVTHSSMDEKEEQYQELFVQVRGMKSNQDPPLDLSQTKKSDYDKSFHLSAGSSSSQVPSERTLHVNVEAGRVLIAVSATSHFRVRYLLNPSFSSLAIPQAVQQSLPSLSLPNISELTGKEEVERKVTLPADPYIWKYFVMNVAKNGMALFLTVLSPIKNWPWGELKIQKGGIPSKGSQGRPVQNYLFHGEKTTDPPLSFSQSGSAQPSSVLSFLILSPKEVQQIGGGEWFAGLHGSGQQGDCEVLFSAQLMDTCCNLPLQVMGEKGGDEGCLMRVFTVPRNRWSYLCVDVFSALMEAGLDLDNAPSVVIQLESSLPLTVKLSKGTVPSLFEKDEKDGEREEKGKGEEEEIKKLKSGSDNLFSATNSDHNYEVPMTPFTYSSSSSSLNSVWYRGEIRLESSLFQNGEGVDQWYVVLVGGIDNSLVRACAYSTNQKNSGLFTPSVKLIQPISVETPNQQK